MATARIAAEYVYTLDSREPIRNGYVEYDTEDGRILAVGQCEEGEEVLRGALVPGFVNSHCHIELGTAVGEFFSEQTE